MALILLRSNYAPRRLKYASVATMEVSYPSLPSTFTRHSPKQPAIFPYNAHPPTSASDSASSIHATGGSPGFAGILASVDFDKIRLGDIGTEKTIRADGVASVTTGALTSPPICHGFCLAPHHASSSQELVGRAKCWSPETAETGPPPQSCQRNVREPVTNGRNVRRIWKVRRVQSNLLARGNRLQGNWLDH